MSNFRTPRKSYNGVYQGPTVRFNQGLKKRTNFSNQFATTDEKSGSGSTLSFIGRVGERINNLPPTHLHAQQSPRV